MMKGMIQLLLSAATAVMLSGCATAVMRTSLSGSEPMGLYPATRADVTGTISFCKGELDPFGFARGAGDLHRPNIIDKLFWIVFAAIDLPISLVTDTLCFPWDLSKKQETKQAPTTGRTVPSSAGASGGQ
jgi:uncharacterized protein YceK